MKTNILNLFLATALFASTASAENRATLGYSFGASGAPDTWSTSVEGNGFDVYGASVYGGLKIEDSTSGPINNSLYTATVGGEYEFNTNWLVKAEYSYVFTDTGSDFDAGTVALVYQGDLWRFEGSVVNPSIDGAFGALSAERNLIGDFSLGLASRFDENSYLSTSLFAAYTF
jgi:hypothetical protein